MNKTIDIGVKKSVMFEYNTDNIKNSCFICGKKINNSEDYYELYGNCCRECGGLAEKRIKVKNI